MKQVINAVAKAFGLCAAAPNQPPRREPAPGRTPQAIFLEHPGDDPEFRVEMATLSLLKGDPTSDDKLKIAALLRDSGFKGERDADFDGSREDADQKMAAITENLRHEIPDRYLTVQEVEDAITAANKVIAGEIIMHFEAGSEMIPDGLERRDDDCAHLRFNIRPYITQLQAELNGTSPTPTWASPTAGVAAP